MPTIQVLKKKLKGIRSTQKIAKAMKTASTVKFSHLNGIYGKYGAFADAHREIYGQYRDEYAGCFAPSDPSAPRCFVVISGNKGMCGSFNSELLDYAEERLCAESGSKAIVCGRKAELFFKEKHLQYEKSFFFDDVPKYEDAVRLFEYVLSLLKGGVISSATLVYQHYVNMMRQTPVCLDLFFPNGEAKDSAAKNGETEPLFFPDKESVIQRTANGIICAFLYGVLLESAIGAQAATLMTMRSAYDTASEYSLQLESEINRKRQSRVTADVIETSSERPQEER